MFDKYSATSNENRWQYCRHLLFAFHRNLSQFDAAGLPFDLQGIVDQELLKELPSFFIPIKGDY